MRRQLYLFISILILTPACGERAAAEPKAIPNAWKMLQLPQQNVAEISAESDDNFLELKFEKTEPASLRKRIDQTLKGAGFKQVCNQFEDTVRGYEKAGERLVLKIDGGDGAWLWVLSGKSPKAAKDMFYGLCFKEYKTKKVSESKGGAVIQDEISR